MMRRLCLALTLLSASCHTRDHPRFPPPAPLLEQGSGEPPAAPSPLRIAACNAAHLLWAIEVRQKMPLCAITPNVMLSLTASFHRARHHERMWQIGCIVSILVALFSLVVLSHIWYKQWKMKMSRRDGMPGEDDAELRGIKVVYLRPDAWPMRVEHPDGDQSLTVPVEPTEMRESEFTWVQMESPHTRSSRLRGIYPASQVSPSSHDTTSPARASGSRPSPPAHSPSSASRRSAATGASAFSAPGVLGRFWWCVSSTGPLAAIGTNAAQSHASQNSSSHAS